MTVEKGDTDWKAMLRARQVRYRIEHLELEPGPMRPPKIAADGRRVETRDVGSMLPLRVSEPGFRGEGNFLNEAVRGAVDRRLERRSSSDDYWPRSIARDRLFRNMLSSQPAAFNLFGNLVDEPEMLRPWISARVDAGVDRVTEIRIEWAPPPREHFNNGTAFDACVFYEADGEAGFVAIECKYAEDLRAGFRAKTADRYRDQIEALDCWDGPFAELNTAGHQQFLLNVSLAESLRQKGPRRRAHAVVMACEADQKAEAATRFVADRLSDGRIDLIWSPFDEVLSDVGDFSWTRHFRRRYLEGTA